jgi:hypothetical protein
VVPPPHHGDALRSSDDPAGVMWPDEGSGFDPSVYSPAGQLNRDSVIAANWRDDPGRMWRLTRNLVLAVLAVVAVIFVIAVISAALG